MRFIPTRIHGTLDYIVGATLLAQPWIFGFSGATEGSHIPIVLGFITILYSLITDYEPGAIKFIPMPVHLAMDLLSGALLASSPWLFGFSKFIYLPHLLIGVLEMSVSLMTKFVPGRKRTGNLVEQGYRRYRL